MRYSSTIRRLGSDWEGVGKIIAETNGSVKRKPSITSTMRLMAES